MPLKEVDRSGGSSWNKDKKMKYANDLDDSRTLIAVDKSANRAKSDKDPSDWLPNNKKFQCEYIKLWKAVKKEWKLSYDKKEMQFIKNKFGECNRKI